MPPQLLLNDGSGRFTDVSEHAGPPWKVPRLARGLAAGDLDNDGRTDLVMVAENAPLALLCQSIRCQRTISSPSSSREQARTAMPSVPSGRDGLGPYAGGRAVRRRKLSFRERSPASFRPGTAEVVDRIEVTWPSGRRTYRALATNNGYRIVEGTIGCQPAPRALGE